MKQFYAWMMVGGILGSAATTAVAEQATTTEKSDAKSEIVLETLLSRSMEVAKGTDVIVDRVSLPPNTSLSRRWHPGETFVYVMRGSLVLFRDGDPVITGKQGDIVEVPLKKIYAARTNHEGAELVLLRVHEAGQPIRVKVE